MADHGTLQWAPETPTTNAILTYSLAPGQLYGGLQWASDGSKSVSPAMMIGQIWPRSWTTPPPIYIEGVGMIIRDSVEIDSAPPIDGSSTIDVVDPVLITITDTATAVLT